MKVSLELIVQIPGVSQLSNEKIYTTLKKLPHLERARLFGSRAIGTFKTGSDIDLCLFGEELEMRDIVNLKMQLDDLNVPYLMDICLWKHLDSEAFKSHILTKGKDLNLSLRSE